ncbi:MAG: acyl-CoA synthetase [Rhizobiales bacterium]|nr:acyl-CoA synthetase [Hyphomicrobiales bacterium]
MPSKRDQSDLARNEANFQPLTPLTYLTRAASVHPEHVAIIHGRQATTYAQYLARARALASALTGHGIARGGIVSVMLSNTPAMLEAHYGVAMAGAVLHSINTRLDAASVAFQLDHAGSAMVITDREFAATMKEALARAKVRPLVVDYDDPQFPQSGEHLGSIDYEALIAGGDPDFAWVMPQDEWDTISLNYTSGTTGNPKGVIYSHRGAYLMGYANVLAGAMQAHPVYLWTLPMFHCNGWCFPWTVPVVAGTQVCLRWVRAPAIYDAIAAHGVTHLCGAPIVMSTLLNAPEEERRAFAHKVHFLTAAAPPPEAVLEAMASAGFDVTHLYGLTETYGPAVVNDWKGEWNSLAPGERAQLKSRQGVRYSALESLSVRDPATMDEVSADGATIGEIMFRGNIVMKGYLNNRQATDEAFAGGWFHSGDLGVLHPDGYIQLKDRSKDIIISGGENISSIEVEDVLYKHNAVAAAAVVAKPDEKWGETPCAFVELKPDHNASSEELVEWCLARLARFKAPRLVVFGELPKTSTGKIQKYLLRQRAQEL